MHARVGGWDHAHARDSRRLPALLVVLGIVAACGMNTGGLDRQRDPRPAPATGAPSIMPTAMAASSDRPATSGRPVESDEPAASGDASPGPVPSGEPVHVFYVANGGLVTPGATVPTTFELDRPARITSVVTYHFVEPGGLPGTGTIELRDAAGTSYGPWPTVGQDGQGGIPNAYWTATVDLVLPPGTYTVIDSDPSTWSQNDETGGAGMAWAWGYPDQP
jgi:hypothetical protein